MKIHKLAKIRAVRSSGRNRPVTQKYLWLGTRAPGLDKHLRSAVSASPAPTVPRSLGAECQR
jgi:hypothetical protein